MATLTGIRTLADLLALPDDGLRYELVGGELVVMPPPDVDHMLIAGEIYAWFHQAQREGFGLAGMAPCAVGLDYPQRGRRGIDGPEPDVFFVLKERAGIVRGSFVQGVPDLIVEVLSPKTRQDDLPDGSKWQTYLRNRVPLYWVVDPAARTVTQYACQGGHFVERAVLQAGDRLVCPLFPSITREVADLFADLPA